MPIFEFYCPDNNRIYQFLAKTQAQAARIPKCPDNPKFRMQKIVSRFAVNTGVKEAPVAPTGPDSRAEDARSEAALSQVEREFEHLDEANPREMGKVLRRMAELTGEKIEGRMEEAVRKLEEGVDPDELEERLGGDDDGDTAESAEDSGKAPEDGGSGRARARRRKRRVDPVRDPRLHDYD